MNCSHCSGQCVKCGRRNGIQKFRCKACKKYQQDVYTYRACSPGLSKRIIELLKEGVGMRGIARVLRISLGSVLRRIRALAKTLKPPITTSPGGIYEVDELWTYVKNKSNEVWITYSFDRHSRSIVDFNIGNRTRESLNAVITTTLGTYPSKICTDGLIAYRSLIPANCHRVGSPHTHRIERFNLTLRMHLKRLARKTICFTKSVDMLDSCLRIYFWSAR